MAQEGFARVHELLEGMASATESQPIRDSGGSIVDENGTVRTVSRAFANATASGDTAVVAAQGGSVRIRVISAHVHATTAVSVLFRSATTAISATNPVGATGGYVLPRNIDGWFQTAANEALNINLSGNVATGVTVTWVPAT
jgi:hypothetical protein